MSLNTLAIMNSKTEQLDYGVAHNFIGGILMFFNVFNAGKINYIFARRDKDLMVPKTENSKQQCGMLF